MLQVRNRRIDELVDGLMTLRGLSKTEILLEALEREWERAQREASLEERLRPLQDFVARTSQVGVGGRQGVFRRSERRVIVVDASAIVAVLNREPGFEALVNALKAVDQAVTSPLAVYEAALAMRRILGCQTHTAERLIVEFLAAGRITVCELSPDIAHDALVAFDRFGKGTGHAAKLNLCDCFAYAQAMRLSAALLFTGDDFSRTDISVACVV